MTPLPPVEVDWTEVAGAVWPGYALGTCIYSGECGAWSWSAAIIGAVPIPGGSEVGPAVRATSKALLAKPLALLEKYGTASFRQLQNGRLRYYGELVRASKEGTMAGRRLVRELDPSTGAVRTWHETLDQAGRVRIIRAEDGAYNVHYMFDEAGNFVGIF
jgi:hypothetical protein